MWRKAAGEAAQQLPGAVLGLPGPLLAVLTLLSVPLVVVGVPLRLGPVTLTRRLAGTQRDRLGVPSPYPPPADRREHVRELPASSTTWRDLAWLLGQSVAGPVGAVLGPGLWLLVVECLSAPVAGALIPGTSAFHPLVLRLAGDRGPWTWSLVPLGLLLAGVAYRLPGPLLAGQDRMARWLLAPTAGARLTARVDQLTESRAAGVDLAGTELRRIERDLHDGVQARLVALAMSLGMAEDAMTNNPAGARALLGEARETVEDTLAELRDLVRGIHPPVLADRGLAGAVAALALSAAVPIALDLRVERRLPAPLETAAYFAVAEGLSNALRHGAARGIRISVLDTGAALRIRVQDEGPGGADPDLGTGLSGVARRLFTFDGTLQVSSPPGGPTVLVMELPCGY